jgi:hypothetical protein
MTAPARQSAHDAPVAPRHDPLLDLLARMIRTAHDRERAERRATLTVVEGGKR